jgi:tripartite-type tricarboxylate transporter receptor subunit TctC
MRWWMRWGAAALAVAWVTSGSGQAAEPYPVRPVKFIVPFAAGSVTDITARIVADYVSAKAGQTVVVENMAGASGMIASQSVARAAPDGYTVLIATNTTHAANPSLFKHLSYDPIKDFEPVAKLGSVPLALVINPSVPAKDLKEFLAYARANPGKLSFGSGSASSRVAGEMLKTMAGIDLVHVAYRSNPQAITDILGGHIQVFFADAANTLPQIRSGKLTGLAISTAKRSSIAPDLPTMAEAGIPGYDISAWFGAFLPAKTAPDIVTRLHQLLAAATTDTGVREKLFAAGIDAETSTPDELRTLLPQETKRWAEVIKAAGIEPQ